MLRACSAAALLFCGVAAAAPNYSVATIVHAADYAPGPFAPNSILTIFGADLSRSAYALTANDIRGGVLPLELNSTQVLVDNSQVPLFFVSETQINFLMPGKQMLGDVRVQVVRQGQAGPIVMVPVLDAAPALFALPNGYAIATHADNSLITPESPARPGEFIVIYATGLGKTDPNLRSGELSPYPAQIVNLSTLKVSVGDNIKYAGLTPGFAGLYQINLILPLNPGTDPELRVSVSGVSSAPGLRLAVQ